MRASLGPLAVVGALLLLLHSSIPATAQFEADAYVGYGTSLYFPFGGTTGAGFRDYFQNGDFPALTLDYWVKSYGGSAVQHMARFCHMTFITSSDMNYLQTFQNEYQTLEGASTTGSVAEYNTMGVRHFHRLGGPEKTLPISGPLDWSRWTVTITPTTLKLFINGTNIYSTTYDSKALELDLTNQAYFTLGMYTFNPGQTIKTTNFYGQIDELYMWSKEISDADIAANWQNTRLTAADATMKVYHSMDSTTKKSGGPSGTYLENQGTGGSSYDLILGGFKDGTSFKDSNTEEDFTGTMPLLVPSTVPYTSVDESFAALNVAVRGYSSSGEAQYTRIRLPYKITIKFKSSGDLNDRETSAALTDNSAVATDDFVYKPPVTAITQDLLSYNKPGDATDYSMAILVTDTLKISDDDSTPNIAVTPVEDKLFSMNLGCTSNVGSDCKVKVLEDNENCLYQTKFMSNEAADFNIDAKVQVGDTLNGPGYAICKLANDRSGTIENAAKFQLIDDFGETLDVTAKYEVQAMDDVPIGTNKTVNIEEDSAATKIGLDVLDPETDMYTIAITKLPSKGKLYFEASDGRKGAEITMPFTPWSAKASTYQWAFNVTSVSSFWGNGKNVDYHPIQVLGEQSTTSFGDSTYAWSPLWKEGGSSYTEGGDDIITFAHDPVAYFAANGSYEYIEVSFEESKYITGVEIGECRGMGSIVKVMAWSETGNKYYTLWEGTASNDIQKHHALFQSYRVFGPSICQPPFKSDRVRIEMDTKAVPDWNEIDYIKMFGSNELPDGTLSYPTTSVYYEPNKDAYGEDTFKFVGYDCPYNRYRKSEDAAITINIAQVNDEPELTLTEIDPQEGIVLTFASLGFLVNQDDDEINLKIASVSSDIVLFDGAARITAFPYTGKLTDLSLNVTNCRTGEIQFSMKDTGGSAESAMQTVKISPVCHQRPTACGQAHWNFVVSGCDSNNKKEGTYSWKNPRPESPFLPSDCCIEGQNFGGNGSPCVEGANLPKNFTFDCEYIVADSPVSIAMIVLNILVILVLVLLMVIYALKAGEKAIRRSQPVFVILACCGGILGLLTPFWMIGEPSDATCALTPISVFFGVTLMYSAFLTKMLRIDMIFNNQEMNKIVLPTNKMIRIFAKIAGVVTIILIVHLSVAPPEARTEYRIVNGESVTKMMCKDNTGDITFLLTIFIHAILVIYSAYVAYKIKDVQDDFQESKSIFYGLYNTTCVCIVILPMVLAMDLGITVRFLLVSLAAIVAFGGTCIGITGSKAFYATAGSVVPSINNTATDILNSKMVTRNSSVFANQQKTTKSKVSPMTTPLETPNITPPPTTG